MTKETGDLGLGFDRESTFAGNTGTTYTRDATNVSYMYTLPPQEHATGACHRSTHHKGMNMTIPRLFITAHTQRGIFYGYFGDEVIKTREDAVALVAELCDAKLDYMVIEDKGVKTMLNATILKDAVLQFSILLK